MPLFCGQAQPSGRLNRVSRERAIGIGIHAGECELRRRVSLRRPDFERRLGCHIALVGLGA